MSSAVLADTEDAGQIPKKTALNDQDVRVNRAVLPELSAQLIPTVQPLPPEKKFELETLPINRAGEEAVSLEPAPQPGLRGDVLRSRPTVLTTAHHLQRGEILTNFRYRQSFPSGSASDVGLTGQPTFAISWGATDNLEITLDAQTVDNAGPGEQGDLTASRTTAEGSGNFFQELTLQAKQRIWENLEENFALSGVLAVSRGIRSYQFFNENGQLDSGSNTEELVVSLELPFTVKTDDRWQFTLSPKVAFLPEDNALYFRRLPDNDDDSFGTTLGLAGAVSYQVNPRLILWGDTFIPFTGNNSLNQDTGRPARSIAFNTGLRYLVNPRLATDLFISNTLGNTGALSAIADRESISLGLGVTFLPAFTAANRQYPQHFGDTQNPPPFIPAGFGFLDGGTIANQQLLTTLQGGSQGLLASIQYGLLDDFEIGGFIDSISGDTDESEIGLSGKIRFLHQADGDPFTLSGLVTVSKSNNVLLNFLSGNSNELENRGLEEEGFVFSSEVCSDNGGVSKNDGECLMITLSAPMHYQLENGSAVWLTPTLGYVQRNGLEIAGFNLGGSVPLGQNITAIAEAGFNLTGDGNALVDDDRKNLIPWALGVRWNAASLFNWPVTKNLGPQVELYLTNRVGSSPFQTLRVREDNDIAVGAGILFPLQF
ncbi:transporter [Microcoleus sp. FACHB-672]|uniref:transporter n=1 Tax=Microcoleus sp. FACHB-672 TaxID=2692825 RepID=UPI001F54A854|nr:transporter [Microcoleus sp. FACHB-672]